MKVLSPLAARWRRLAGSSGSPVGSPTGPQRTALPAAVLRPLRHGASLLRRQSQPSPLALALLAALALHLLVLSALPLRQRRQAPAAEAPTRDDTPELLLFSRQQSQEPALSPLSVSALSQLPPPPPLAPPATAERAPAQGQQRRDLAIRPARPQAGPTATSRPGRAAATSRPGGKPVPLPILKTALAALPALQAGSGAAAPSGSEPGWPAPQKAQPEELTLWTRLWEKARPAAKGRGPAEALPSTMELRWLPAGERDGTPWPESRRLTLILGDRLLLVWSSGEDLWLLQAPALRPDADGEPQGT